MDKKEYEKNLETFKTVYMQCPYGKLYPDWFATVKKYAEKLNIPLHKLTDMYDAPISFALGYPCLSIEKFDKWVRNSYQSFFNPELNDDGKEKSIGDFIQNKDPDNADFWKICFGAESRDIWDSYFAKPKVRVLEGEIYDNFRSSIDMSQVDDKPSINLVLFSLNK